MTFAASGLPVRRRLSVRPSGGEPSPSAWPAPARLRAAWQPRAPAGRTTCPRCPSPAPAKIWFPPSRAAVIVNRREPGAYIYRETRVPKAAVSAASDCLLKKNFASFARGFPTSIFKLQAKTAGEYKLQERAILFLRAFCLGAFAVPCKSSRTPLPPRSLPAPASPGVAGATCALRRVPQLLGAPFVLQ